MIGAQRYGFAIEQVIRVRPIGRCTPVPNAPRGVIGVAKLEGKVVAVFGGRTWRGLPEQVTGETPVLILGLGSQKTPLALLVDSVVDTLDLPEVVPDLRGSGEPWLRAIVGEVLLVDVDRLIELVSDHRALVDRGT
ncbi:MAG: chemotaxis protein CheW [Deltaproteobacteria bacterium]|nr:chemotaxis protein CheW [Deltaproteobacteria bacterium]